MEIVGDLNIVHLFTSLLLGSIGVAVFFFKTTNALDKRITALETKADIGKNSLRELRDDMKDVKQSLNKISNELHSLVAVLRSKNIVNGDYKHHKV